MRNTAGQPSDRFHFVRLQQVRLEAPPLGNIPCDTLHGNRLPHSEYQPRARLHGHADTLLGDEIQLVDGLGLATDLAVQHFPAQREEFRSHVFVEVLSQQFLAAVAEKQLAGLKGLRHLILRNTRTTASGIAKLRRALPQ